MKGASPAGMGREVAMEHINIISTISRFIHTHAHTTTRIVWRDLTSAFVAAASVFLSLVSIRNVIQIAVVSMPF